MTFVQLEYILAVDTHRHFAEAAESCHVTQPTLSMQIQKLESAMGIQIFDRSKHPVMPTEMGELVIQQARKILAERTLMDEMVQAQKGVLKGELRIGIIPTLAPYVLPLFVQPFSQNHPDIKLIVQELKTERIVSRLRESRLDVGILVTPLNDNTITEHVLFYEKMLAYVSEKSSAYKKTLMLPQDINPEKLWLLEEGHCFRSQILNLCELRKAGMEGKSFNYEAGSLETLRRMVEITDGITILPELATLDLAPEQQHKIREFKKPHPMREVSMVVHRDFVKKRLIEALKSVILSVMPDTIKNNKKSRVVSIETVS
ncbi:MAG: transcriptional regulator, LysR family [Segetibacter sp.]|jgi:LysR family hydrogen peroxide-inducible transcriptional activator|nr:transcriptional regulator, LysR family [Segetibacter sp.]